MCSFPRRAGPRGGGFARRLAAWVPLLVLLAIAGAGRAEAAPEQAAPAAAAPAGPEDPFDRGTPRSAMLGYLVAAREGDFERAARYLDLRRIPASRRDEFGPELARKLKVILDRTLWVDFEALSPDPTGDTTDGLPKHRDRVGVIESARGPVPVYLDRVPREGDGVRIWKISSRTVAAIPDLWEEFGYGPLAEYLPEVFFTWSLLEIQLWQWLGLVTGVLLAFGLSWFIARWILRVFAWLVRRTENDLDDRILEAVIAPVRLLLAVAIFAAVVPFLALSVPAARAVGGLEKALVIAAITWIAFRAVDVFELAVKDRLAAENHTVTTLLPVGRRVTKVLLGALAVLAALQNFGINVTAVLAGLGVGGLAVALAAQKTVENVFGGITVVADRPVRVGDFCRWGDGKVGTVEDIGLRSTRIRTLDRTLVTVPNATFSQLELENFAARDRIRLYAVLGLRYETTPDQLRYVLVEIRKLLRAHPKITPDPARIRFVGFGAYSLDLEVFAYADTSDWNEFLAIREDVFLRVMDVVERSGTGFAFPSNTTYLARDEGVDPERSRAAEQTVQSWRERGELPMPDFDPELARELEGTLDWPPEGSVSRGRGTSGPGRGSGGVT